MGWWNSGVILNSYRDIATKAIFLSASWQQGQCHVSSTAVCLTSRSNVIPLLRSWMLLCSEFNYLSGKLEQDVMLGKSLSNLENMIRIENAYDRSIQNHKLQIQSAALGKEHSNVQVQGEGQSLFCFLEKVGEEGKKHVRQITDF